MSAQPTFFALPSVVGMTPAEVEQPGRLNICSYTKLIQMGIRLQGTNRIGVLLGCEKLLITLRASEALFHILCVTGCEM